MTDQTHPASTHEDRARVIGALRRDALAYLVLGLIGLAAIALMLVSNLDLSARDAVQMMLAYGVITGAVLIFLPAHLPQDRFGLANVVTLMRAMLVAVLAGLIGDAGLGRAGLSWLIVAIATAALILDGLDGWLARRLRISSPFGARFDRELDGCLVLVLSVLLWQTGKAGPWVLMIGLLHYLFLLAGLLLPAFTSVLPESRLRQWIGVTQTIVLLVCLSPLMTSPWSERLLALGLVVLLGSFCRDVVRVLSRPSA